MDNENHAAETLLRQMSEWLLYSAALGNGIRSELPETKGLVFTSGISPAAHESMREAERAFRVWHDEQMTPQRLRLAELEEAEAARPSRREISQALPWDQPAPNSAVSRTDEIKQLRESLAKIPAVTWREQDVSKSTMVEMLQRSAYEAITYVDEFGSRVPALLYSYKASDFGWITLTGTSTADTALIRSSATGGANIHSLAGAKTARFNYISCPTQGSVRSMIKSISKPKSLCPAKGFTLLLPSSASTDHRAKPLLESDKLLRIMKTVFARTDAASKVVIRCENEELRSLWMDFIQADASYFTGKEPSAAAGNIIGEMPASLRVIVSFATKAVIAKCVAESVDKPGFQSQRSAVLTAEHLDEARRFAAAAFAVLADLGHLDVRRGNAERARASLKSVERVDKALDVMRTLIEESADCRVSFTKAVRTPGVTAGLLEELVKQGSLIELRGRDDVGMKNKTKRAFTIPGGCAQGDMFGSATSQPEAGVKDPEEAVAELESATREYESAGKTHSGGDLVVIYRELQRKAERNSIEFGVPAVPLHHMNSKEIAALPEIVEDFSRETKLRGTATTPEPEALFEDEAEDEDCLLRGVPNLWFRFHSDGRPMRDWKLMRKFELTEWAAKE
jgi:hypothetical protein